MNGADIACKFCRDVTAAIVLAVALAVLSCVGFLVWTLIEFGRLLP